MSIVYCTNKVCKYNNKDLYNPLCICDELRLIVYLGNLGTLDCYNFEKE